MQDFIFGALGVLLALAVLGLGFFGGWRARGMWERRIRRKSREELTEQQRRELLAEQRAFGAMMNYNADVAYGLTPTLEDIAAGGEGS